jgi:hypothetical protein
LSHHGGGIGGIQNFKTRNLRGSHAALRDHGILLVLIDHLLAGAGGIDIQKNQFSLTYGDEEIKDNKAFAKSGAALKVLTDISDKTGDLSFRWYKDDKEISGATKDSYVVTEYATYYCVVSNLVAGEDYKEDVTTDKVEIVQNEISFQDVVNRAESRSTQRLTLTDNAVSYDSEKIELGDGFSQYSFTGGNAVVKKSLVISSSAGASLLNKSKLSIIVSNILKNLGLNLLD